MQSQLLQTCMLDKTLKFGKKGDKKVCVGGLLLVLAWKN